MYDWKERSHVSQQVWICTRCIVRGAAEQLCATLGTKLAQSRETPLAAAASRHQAANYRSLTSVALFFTGIVVESRDRWMFRRSPPRPTLGLQKSVADRDHRISIAGNAMMAKHTLANNHTILSDMLALQNKKGQTGKQHFIPNFYHRTQTFTAITFQLRLMRSQFEQNQLIGAAVKAPSPDHSHS